MKNDFRESIKINSLTKSEMAKHSELDAYKDFINAHLEGFLEFIEIVNQLLKYLEKSHVIGKVKLTARLKSIRSSLENTDKKELDDIFGMSIIAKNERDKEIVMLILHQLFGQKNTIFKNHNKSNGYKAHHCTGGIEYNQGFLNIHNIEEYIKGAKAIQEKEEYRDLSKSEKQAMYKKDLFTQKPRYPVLLEEILQSGELLDDEIKQALIETMIFVESYFKSKKNPRKSIGNIPVMEIQFKTEAVEQEIISGRAGHAKYKETDEKEIIQLYRQGRLIRGIDFPFIFVRNSNDQIELETTDKTLISIWSFLKKEMERYKSTHTEPLSTYDMYLAEVFQALKPYVNKLSKVEPYLPIKNRKKEEIWQLLKLKILNKTFKLTSEESKQREEEAI